MVHDNMVHNNYIYAQGGCVFSGSGGVAIVITQRKMNEICTRCTAQLEMHQISWKFNESREINLKGPPVFIRVSLFGQTQSSRLFNPVFPLCINESVTADRIFTNCKLQTLLPEMLRDEQVIIELIQLKPDCTGGKVLGRCVSSTHSVLFPVINKQFLTMTKSQRYQHPPCIQITTTVSISDAIIRSPLSITAPSINDPALRLQNNISTTQERIKNITNGSVTNRPVATSNNQSDTGASLTSRDDTIKSTPNKPTRSTIINKYLSATPPTSSYEMVRTKVDKVLEKYWDSKVEDNHDLDDDDLDNEEVIKNSFAAEREHSLNRTSQSIPHDSLLTQLGPTDYWSRQLAQYNDESHRTVFNETMEKIYNRLYHRSVQYSDSPRTIS